MNKQPQPTDQNFQQNYDINRTITNPLLESMDSCPYYRLDDQKKIENENVKEPNQSLDMTNPYYPAQNVEPQPSTNFEEAPVFHNTPQIQIKLKQKKQRKKSQSLPQQEYIKLNNDGKGEYKIKKRSRSSSDCCNLQCCDDQCCSAACFTFCLRCICEIGLPLVLQVIFKK